MELSFFTKVRSHITLCLPVPMKRVTRSILNIKYGIVHEILYWREREGMIQREEKGKEEKEGSKERKENKNKKVSITDILTSLGA